MNHLPWSYHDYGGRKQVPTLSVQPCFVPCMHGRLARPPDVSAPSLRQNWPHSEAMLVWASGGNGYSPKNPKMKKDRRDYGKPKKSIKIQVSLVFGFSNFQKPGQPGQPIVGIHLTSIISTARTAWTLAGAIRQNTAGWNPRAYASSAQAGRWNGWNATSLGGNPSIHRPGDRDFRSPHFKNYPKCLDGAKRQRCWASEVHKIHRVWANSHMCTI